MTRRARIIIAILILIPVVISFRYYREWKNENKVIAEYGESAQVVIYNDIKLYAVPKDECSYSFRFGDYLGKIDSALFGTQLYTVRDDTSGMYFAMAGTDGGILLTTDGKLADGVRRADSSVTRVISGNWESVTENATEIALLMSITAKQADISFIPDSYTDEDTGAKAYTEYPVMLCFDGSAVSTETAGSFIHLTERNRWLFLSAENAEAGEKSYSEGESEKLTYSVSEAESISEIRMLQRFLLGETEESTDASEAAE